MKIDQVLLFSVDSFSRYLTISCILVSGLFQMLKKRENTSLCIFPSIGSSPVRKCSAGMLEHLLNLRMDLSDFLWKMIIGWREVCLSVNDESPDLSIGQVNVLYRWSFTTGLRRHLYENAGPRRLNRDPLPFFSLRSDFFYSKCLESLKMARKSIR